MAGPEAPSEMKELAKVPERIRNICTSAHIHHGKCIDGKSRLILANGEIKTAEQIYQLAEQKGQKFEEKEEHTIYDVSKEKITIFSLNQTTGQLEKKDVSLAWKLKGGQVIKIKLRNGFEISSTPEHKYVVFENMRFVEKIAGELRIDDQVVCAKNLDFFWKEKKANKEEYDIIKIVTNHGRQNTILVQKNTFKDLAFVEVENISEGYEETVYDFTVPENHTFVAEGIVMHNTALTDNLLAASGHISSKAAGDLEAGMATWQHADEQERLLTVDAANVSMCHTFDGNRYLINLIDTPGHVDFGGNVTRAMRAVDGTIVLICAVEGIMPQTETVVRQAIRERVKPVLFINKVDRLINELKFTPEQMQERFLKLIMEFNTLIENTAEDEYKKKWQVDILNGSVAFGSARENWALSIPYMKKKNVSFKDIVNLYKEDVTEEDRQKWIWEKAPVFEVILEMVIKHLPTPLEAQKYRIPHIWHGDLDTQFGKDLLVGNPNGKIAFVITRITIDPRFGRELCAGRLFSGTVREGQTVYLNNAKDTQRIAQVFMYKGIKPESIDSVSAGNVLALGGISGMAGETITEGPETPFEELKHIFEPVITKAIEPKRPQDLPKLVEVLKKVLKEDPSIKIDINQETGENLIHGMGELHLEIIENRIKTEKGLDIKTSPPIVVYRESMQKPGQEMEGKSPNKHNKFYIVCEPLEENVHAAIKKGDIPEGRVSKKDTKLYDVLEKLGWAAKEAKKVRDIFNGNMLIDDTRGIVYIGEVQELITDGFEQVMKQGPIAREPVIKMKVIVKDCKLHEDAIHRGPAQVVPAIRESIRGSMNSGNAVLYEPLQVLQIDAPADYMGEISKLVQNKRGQLLNVKQEGNFMSIRAKLPVAESFGLASDLRSATEGRGSYFLVDQMFEKLPSELQLKVMQRIRERKGLKVEEETPTE